MRFRSWHIASLGLAFALVGCGDSGGDGDDDDTPQDAAMDAPMNQPDATVDAGCVTHAQCNDGDFCNGTELCTSGTCESPGDPCTGMTSDAGGDLVCDEDANACVGCLVDDDCDDVPSMPICDDSMCVECTMNSDCSGNSSGEACNTVTHRCVECLIDGDCSGTTPFCNVTANECIGCTADAECTGMIGTEQCATTGTLDGACVECNGNEDCLAPTSACDIDTGTCVASDDASLSAVAVSALATGAVFAPAFNSATLTGYEAVITNTPDTADITATVNHPEATLELQVNTGGFTAITSGVAETTAGLTLGPNDIEVRVTAEDGTTQQVYEVTVHRPSYIFVTPNEWDTFTLGISGSPDDADDTCQNEADILAGTNPSLVGLTFQAMIVDGVNRRMCDTTANCTGVGQQIDWVLAPDTHYVRVSDQAFIGRTTVAGRFELRTGQPLGPLTNPFEAGGGPVPVWTGLDADWTPHGDDCTDWSASGAGVPARIGDATQTGQTSISSGSVGCQGSVDGRLICVQQ